MIKKGLPEEYKKELEKTGKIHIPNNAPKATTPAQTDELLKVPDNIKNRLDKYLSLLNENEGALVPHIYAEIKKLKDKNPNIKYNFWEVLEGIIQGQADALAILQRARESLKKSQILENPEKRISRPLPQIKTYGIQNDTINNNLVCSDYVASEIDGQLQMIFSFNQSKKNTPPAKVIIALSYEGDQPLTSKKITGYDRAVFNAVSTLYHYHKQNYPGETCIVSPQEIWRTMNGISDKTKHPSPAQLKKICSSMDKMRFTRILLDITEEIQNHHIIFNDERLIGGKIDTYYLKADIGHFLTENGRVIEAYRIEEDPILYAYNRAKDRVIFVPFDLLNTADALVKSSAGNEGNTVEIREYLLQQIMLMYKKERDSKRILFNTLYEKTGIEPPEVRVKVSNYSNDNAYKSGIKKEAAKDRSKVTEILEAWKAKDFISGYKLVGTRPIRGVDIILKKNPPQLKA